MSFKQGVLSLVVLGCLTIPAWARLDETDAELMKRYGLPHKVEPIGQGQKRMIFKHEDWVIDAFFYNHSCQAIIYVRAGAESPAGRDQLLQDNSQGKTWEASNFDKIPSPPSKQGTVLARSDGKAFAILSAREVESRYYFYTQTWAGLQADPAPLQPSKPVFRAK